MAEMSQRILPLALYPLISTQGLYVKFRAAQLAEAAGPRSGRIGTGPPLRVLILGDSSAAGVGVGTQDEGLAGRFAQALAPDFDVDWQLVARCGDTTAHALKRLAKLPDQSFDVALTALGVNDAKNGAPLSTWRRNSDALHAMLVERFNTRLVVASGLPPVRHFPLLPQPLKHVLSRRCEQFDAALVEICARRPQVVHLAGEIKLTPALMAEDGFHPNGLVYADWAQRAAAIVRDRLGAGQ